MSHSTQSLPIRQRPLSALGLPDEMLATLNRLTFSNVGQLADYFRGHALTSADVPCWALERAGLTSDEIEALRGRLTSYLTEEVQP